MDFGINADFTVPKDGTHQAAFRESFEEVDLAEEMGLDTIWLGESHFRPNRSVLAAPIVVASSIATRTKRLRVGMAVQVLPMIHPLRIAEEAATVDQLSEGRFEFGVGRSGNIRAYDIMGIDYSESKERFQEALDIILQAWSGETFSYDGKFNHITNATVSPLPYQKPHPKIRIAASSDESFGRIGRLGYPIFLGLRAMDVEDLKTNLQEYRDEWKKAGHPGDGGDTDRQAGEKDAETLQTAAQFTARKHQRQRPLRPPRALAQDRSTVAAAARPSSTMQPSNSRATRPQRAASVSSWVIRISVRPSAT